AADGGACTLHVLAIVLGVPRAHRARLQRPRMEGDPREPARGRAEDPRLREDESHRIRAVPPRRWKAVRRVRRDLRAARRPLAVAFLVPQVYAARRFGVDLAAMPRVVRADAAALALPFVDAARPEKQPDARP